MAEPKDWFKAVTCAGDAIQVGEVTVTPQSRAWIVQFGRFGFVWNRPLAMLVERDGQIERIQIVDVTRIALTALLGASVAVTGIVSVLSSVQHRRNRK